MDDELEIMFKEAVIAYLKSMSWYSPRETIEMLNQGGRYPSRSSNRTPIEYMSEALPLELTCSVSRDIE
jgi:hypothetical protein